MCRFSPQAAGALSTARTSLQGWFSKPLLSVFTETHKNVITNLWIAGQEILSLLADVSA
jgi:hypothetical protein